MRKKAHLAAREMAKLRRAKRPTKSQMAEYIIRTAEAYLQTIENWEQPFSVGKGPVIKLASA